VLFLFFLMPFGRLLFSPTLDFYYLACIVWWRQKTYPKIYIQK
jgi:hypothetical protein